MPISLDFEAIFSATASAYLILDPDLAIVGVNDAYLRSTGRSRDSVIGRHVFDAFPGNPDDPEADGVGKLHRSFRQVLRSGAADRIDFLKYDIPCGDDGRFEVRYWSPINTPVFDGAGKLTHIIHQAEDITSRVVSEAALRESERRFRALTNATGDVIYRMSPTWSHMHELDGRGFLKDTDSLGEYHIEDYVPAEDLETVRQAINRAIRDKAIFEMEHRVLRADGGYGWTFSRAVPILEEDGAIREWVGSASDISARKHAEEKLTDANRRKDEFLAMLAHELRNPLAPISAAAQLLQIGSLDEERIRTTSQIIRRQVTHMSNLVEDLLDVSRVTTGLVQLEKTPVDMRQVVADAVEQAAPLIQSRAQRLEVDLPPQQAIVAGDEKRLVQAIANLLNNAAKFTPEGGAIRLSAEVLAAQIRVDVSDNGVGMSADTARHAFELFAQAERSSDRAAGGLGLGLALVRSLVELHGGSATRHSEGIGKGSRFTVSLPRLPDAVSVERAAGSGESLAGDGGRLRILVVDDNVDAAQTLAMLLEALGHETLVEHDALDALARAGEALPQVFLLDIGLPGMDGLELAGRLRAAPATAGALLVAVTGYGQDAERERSANAGFDHHLVKPVDMRQLAAILAAAPT